MYKKKKLSYQLRLNYNSIIITRQECVTSLKSIMALAINFPRKRNFILILAMCAGLVVLPKGTANSPLVLNMYFIPSWFPDKTEMPCVHSKPLDLLIFNGILHGSGKTN